MADEFESARFKADGIGFESAGFDAASNGEAGGEGECDVGDAERVEQID